MTDSIVEKDVKRRSLLHKLVSLAAGLGIAGLLLGQEKTGLIPQVHAADMVIDGINTGTGTTELDSNIASGAAFFGFATAGTGSTIGVLGDTASTSGIGVEGSAGATTGLTIGVIGESVSTSGIGVNGLATAGTGSTIGVLGEVSSPSGVGVQGSGGIGVNGVASASTGSTFGVFSVSASTSGIGVFARATAATGSTIGVQGVSDSTGGIGVFGEADAATGATIGVFGQSNSGIGVEGFAGGAGAIPIVALGAVGQTADLQEWRNSGGTALAKVSSAGKLTCKGSTSAGDCLPDTDNTRNLGNGTKRWKLIRGVTITSGDLVFENGVKATEDKDGLAFFNPHGRKIALLDSEGNFYVRGEVRKL